MSEFKTPRWLRDELTRDLAAVRAPEALWDRIQNPLEPQSAPAAQWARWPVAAILTLAAAAGTYWLPGKGPAPRFKEALDRPELRRDRPADWDLRCVLPANRSIVRLAGVSVPRGHGFAPAINGLEEEAIGCQICHSTGSNQHHL